MLLSSKSLLLEKLEIQNIHQKRNREIGQERHEPDSWIKWGELSHGKKARTMRACLASMPEIGQAGSTWYESECEVRLHHQWGYPHSFEARKSIA
jgi:uncharacterized sporulation protein YeaH/YhbH (DUF444 family)